MKENSIENLQNKKYFRNIDEAIKAYEEFRKYKDNSFIKSIDPDFFFNLTDMFLLDYKRVLKMNEVLLKENEELKDKYATFVKMSSEVIANSIPVQKVKDIIDRIDYDIKKTKEIISNNSNIYTSDRKNDYQIIRLRAMNTKSLDIKERLQKLIKESEE